MGDAPSPETSYVDGLVRFLRVASRGLGPDRSRRRRPVRHARELPRSRRAGTHRPDREQRAARGHGVLHVTTLAAIDASLDATQAHRLVWVPDMVGSICFLVASGLAWFEVSHGWWSWSVRS